MKKSQPRLAAMCSLLLLLSACGGNVSLGGKSSQPGDTAGASPGSGTASSAGELVLERSEFLFSDLIVVGDYLYLVSNTGTAGGIYRCRKSNCSATFGVFLDGNFGFPRVFGDRLGVTKGGEDGSYGFSSVALSNGSDEQVVISGLPSDASFPGLFNEDFLFFSVSADRGLYRCGLPTCSGNPQRIARSSSSDPITTRLDGEHLFWVDGSFIYRAGGYGSEPAIALLPDDSLSEAPATPDPDAAPTGGVNAIDVSDGVLYASVTHSPDGRDCDSFCPHDVVAWPKLGGAARHLFRSQGRLENLQIFDGELTWMVPSNKTRNPIDASTISTCRIEACEATRRDLGEATFYVSVVADEHDVYWIEAEPLAPLPGAENAGGFQLSQIRRAPRLPAP